MLKRIQCMECKYYPTIKYDFENQEYRMFCDKYKDGVPSFVQDAEEDCPEFEVK